MSVTSLSQSKELGVIYIIFQFLVLCNVFRGEAVPSRAKKQQVLVYKFSIKRFIKA